MFAFGGSTMVGYGAPDWGTIPSYLQADLSARLGQPVCVTNFGDRGYVSTQSMILLERQLQSGHVPDLVIFYDGINDPEVAYTNGEAGTHGDAKFVGLRLEHPLLGILVQSNLVTFLLPKLFRFAGPPEQQKQRDTDRLASQVVEAYMSNCRMVQALSREYGFKHFFFLQPIVSVGNKPLTAEEQRMRSELDYSTPGLAGFTNRVYEQIEARASDSETLVLLHHVFDDQASQLYIDWGHITPEGNRLIRPR